MDARLRDVEVFLVARRLGALTAAARELKVTPGFVSKSLRRLERQLGLELVSRSARGVTLTASGLRVLPLLEQCVANLRLAARGADGPAEVTVAAASFLLSAFVPALAHSVPQVRFRGLQMTEQSIFAMATREQFDAALLLGEAGALPPSWESHPLAPVRFGLFAAPPVAKRLAGATLNRLRAIPFITPISFDQGQWVATEDGCPLSVSERIIGHEVRTIALGLDIAAETNHVVFGPLLAARHHLAQGRLAEVRVDTWVVTRPLTFALNVDRVSARSARSMLATLRALKSD